MVNFSGIIVKKYLLVQVVLLMMRYICRGFNGLYDYAEVARSLEVEVSLQL